MPFFLKLQKLKKNGLFTVMPRHILGEKRIRYQILQLKFGDTDSSEQGYHTLGKLKCCGIAEVVRLKKKVIQSTLKH